MTTLLAVFGRRKSGKTRIIEVLVKALIGEGYRVGVAKHVHHEDFTIDTPGKDSWRFMAAGAGVVYIFAPAETVMIERSSLIGDADSVLRRVKYSSDRLDLVIFEGFHHIFAHRLEIFKIIVGRNKDSIFELLQSCRKPIVGCIITGPEVFDLDDVKVYRIPGSEGELVSDVKRILQEVSKKACSFNRKMN